MGFHILQRGIFNVHRRLTGGQLGARRLDSVGDGRDFGLRLGHLFLAFLNLCVKIGHRTLR